MSRHISPRCPEIAHSTAHSHLTSPKSGKAILRVIVPVAGVMMSFVSSEPRFASSCWPVLLSVIVMVLVWPAARVALACPTVWTPSVSAGLVVFSVSVALHPVATR